MTQTGTEPSVAPLSAETVAQFFEEAATAVGELADAAAGAAVLFRRGDATAANDALTALPAELRNFIIMVTVVENQLGIAGAELTLDGLLPTEQIVRLGEWLQSLVEAQTSGDLLTIGDILEYDLAPFLSAWSSILSAQAGRVGRAQPA